MKRAREHVISSIEETLEVANSLIQISTTWAGYSAPLRQMDHSSTSGHKFECKTCSRTFSSFQALGGHRASHHKKPKQTDGEHVFSEAVKAKAKTDHECSICGIKFGLGQALGGHMRRHRIELKGEVVDVQSHAVKNHQAAKFIPILRRSFGNNKRVMCMDLNLTPLENDLQVLFGKMAPKVDCYLV